MEINLKQKTSLIILRLIEFQEYLYSYLLYLFFGPMDGGVKSDILQMLHNQSINYQSLFIVNSSLSVRFLQSLDLDSYFFTIKIQQHQSLQVCLLCLLRYLLHP